MNVLDCDLSYGRYFDSMASHGLHAKDVAYLPPATIEELAEHMRRCGIAGGLVSNCYPAITGVRFGNEVLARDIQKIHDLELYGICTLLPFLNERESPKPEDLPRLMADSKFVAVTFNPASHQYPAHSLYIGDYLAVCQERKIPVLMSLRKGFSVIDMHNLLTEYPDLVAVISMEQNSSWPSGRCLIPLLKAHPNAYFDTAAYYNDQGIEEIRGFIGAHRILNGSAYPVHPITGFVAYMRMAQIPEEDKIAILSGNLERLIKEADLR